MYHMLFEILMNYFSILENLNFRNRYTNSSNERPLAFKMTFILTVCFLMGLKQFNVITILY